MSTARQILDASDPKKVFRNLAHRAAYTERPVDRARDIAYHFLFGAPIAMSFDIIARHPDEAVRIANIHLREVGRVNVNDKRDTSFHLNERMAGYKLTEKQILMWWPLDSTDPITTADPVMNPNYTG